jgi:hypothetical protein
VYNGLGILKSENRFKYKGNFKNGQPNGQGKLTISDGTVIEGNFENGKSNGKGKKTIPDGTVYEGNFKDNEYNGQGKLTEADGTVYEGIFKDNEYNGQGKLTNADGTVYEGYFENNEYNGQGKLTDVDGTVYKGYFENGQYVNSGNQRTLNQLNEIIKVFDPLILGEQSASDFFDEQADFNPFIIRTLNGSFSGEAIDWPLTRKFFIECTDDAPDRPQFSYKKWVKPNSNRFVKLLISGSPTLVIVPQWYIKNGNQLIGTKYFNLVEAGKIYKFMEEGLNAEKVPDDWNFVGAEHCSQLESIGIYELQEITLQELNSMVPMGGKKYKTNKKCITKNRRKSKKRSRKSKKRSRKSKKHSRKSKKHSVKIGV